MYARRQRRAPEPLQDPLVAVERRLDRDVREARGHDAERRHRAHVVRGRVELEPPELAPRPCPSSAVKITRNISGNANVKNAEAGFRQNALFVNRNWRADLRDRAHSPSPLLARRSARGRRPRGSAASPPACRRRSRVRAPRPSGRGRPSSGSSVRISHEPSGERRRVRESGGARSPPGSRNRIRVCMRSRPAERVRGPLGDDLALRDHRHAVREVLGLVHEVGREEDRLPDARRGSSRSPTRCRRAFGSKPVVGSSRNRSSGSPARAIGDVQPPLLAARELAHAGVALLGQPDEVDDLVHVPGRRVVPGVEVDGLARP